MKRIFKLLLAVAALAALPYGLIRWAEYTPAPEEDVAVDCTGQAATLAPGQTFKVVSWNIQFSGGRARHFFYDGGEDVQVPAQEVQDTLDGLSRTLRELRPDLALLQEVDRDSARTGGVDQLPPLAGELRTPCVASAPYFKSRFVPFPPGDFLGRMDMHLAIVSRFGLRQARRVQLPLLDEPRWRQAFNLKRALLTAELPVEGLDRPLAVAVTHLSAFSKGDGTLDKQVDVLEAWMRARPADQPWILAGDLNLLPPGDDPKRVDGGEFYADDPNPIERLIPAFQEVLGAERQLAANARSYLPPGAQEPDRKIDYAFVGGPLEVLQAQVPRGPASLSDHLPLVFTLRITDGEAEVKQGRARGEDDTGAPIELDPDGRAVLPGVLQPDSGEVDTNEP
ncbi:MAG: endonuclease/exonuclease/phosphatase family protein [Alphaproteobacteria bacterium]|nr:endonuclease/exonuclease/phosphatase family protein [Alphaproteobacteria bacterium]